MKADGGVAEPAQVDAPGRERRVLRRRSVDPTPVPSGHPPAMRSVADRATAAATLVVLSIAGLAVFKTLYRPISDPDTFWHLRLGTYLLETGRFTGPEPWSSLATRPLVLHEWAPEVLFAWVYGLGGWAGLAWLQAVQAVAFLAVLYACTRRFAPPPLAALITLAGFAGASGSLVLRPQVLSFALVAIVTTTWLRTAEDGRPRWWLIPLTWVWACSHGMWFVGVAVGSVVVLGMVLDRRVPLRGAARLAAVPALSIVAAALTPVGPSLLTTASTMRLYTPYVGEWLPPTIFMVQTSLALVLALATAVWWWRSPRRVTWTEIGVFVLGVALALMYVRTVALGATILAILAAATLGRNLPMSRQAMPTPRAEVAVLSTVALLVAAVGPALFPHDVGRPDGVPSAFSVELEGMPDGSVVYNDYVLGGWLLWEHPHLDPVIDGRADVYDIDHFATVVDSYDLAPGWDTSVQESGATIALLASSSPLAHALVDRLGWVQAYTDAGYGLFLPPGQQNP